ncbi:hypothetical protein T492DRAFT_832030 [Pavlovales sp. CCMP2436]|nr:hypothetical protein T492DRAFT_832030 [Pavlovales sp. CCMP2436]
MNGQLIEKLVRPTPTAAPSLSRPSPLPYSAAHTSAASFTSPATQPHWQAQYTVPDAVPDAGEEDEGADEIYAELQQQLVQPQSPSRANTELGRVLAHAEAELEAARADYGRLVEGAYHAAVHGQEVSQAPILDALHRVEAKAAQLDSTRRALLVANEEITSARTALALSNRALAKSSDVAEKRLKQINKLKPPEPMSTVKRLTSSHTAGSVARMSAPVVRPASRGRF